MSTVQELPSPTVSIPYSFLPRNSEDTGHARSNSAPGEFVRDSQTLPNARTDLSKAQWTSKQADSHPAKGLGLSIPAGASVDRLEQRKGSPSTRSKPNLTIEIKHDVRLKPQAIPVRDEDIDYDAPPPPPPPKSPRHDSRNHSLSNITFEPRKARRTNSGTVSRTSSKQSRSSPDSARPSDGATIASQGSIVKAALVDASSPSSPALPKPGIQHAKQESQSPLSGDVKIKQLMATTENEAQDDLERPIPPPITPGMPRVASMARVVSIPSLPKAVSVERPASKQGSQHERGKPSISQSESKSTETIVPIKKADEQAQKVERPVQTASKEAAESKAVKPGHQPESARTVSPTASTTTKKSAKSTGSKASKPNLDKPMPSLPPPSSRFSEHMRHVRAAEGTKAEDAPPVPAIQDTKMLGGEENERKADEQRKDGTEKSTDISSPQLKEQRPGLKQSSALEQGAPKIQNVGMSVQPEERQTKAAMKGSERTEKVARAPGLSAFPSVPPPPRYYGRSAREESPGRPPMQQRPPPREARQQEAPRDSSPARRFPPGHPLHRPGLPPFMPGNRNAAREPGPPRSRFYGRQPDSANNSQTSLVEPTPSSEHLEEEVVRGVMGAAEPSVSAQSPANPARSPIPPTQTPPIEQRTTPALEAKVETEKDSKSQRLRNGSDGKQSGPETKSALLGPTDQTQHHDLLKRPASPANLGRAPSPTPSMRPSHAGDLLDKLSSGKSLPSLPPETGPRPITPDAISVLTTDAKVTPADPIQTLKDLTKQSEALHARHASLRADRLKLSTAISASLKDAKPGPEYANSLLDQHLSLNAINSSLDICFAKLKSLDCKKEEAIQVLLEQAKEKPVDVRRHRATSSVTTHSTSTSISSKPSTPDIGYGALPTLQEKEVSGSVPLTAGHIIRSLAEKIQDIGAPGAKEEPKQSSVEPTTAENSRESLTDGLPTPRAVVIESTSPQTDTGKPPNDVSPIDAAVTSSPEQKRNTMVKMPSVSPAPSLFTKEPVGMSPVSPIEDNGNDSIKPSTRMTIKGAKAAKILGLVAGRSESASGITLPDGSPKETRGSPSMATAPEQKIQRKPLPSAAKTASVAPSPPTRQAPIPPQPGRKRTNDSASTVQTDSSPESEVRTPRGSQEGLMPKGLRIGRKQRPPQPVQVVNDDDILDYYAR